LICHRPPAEEQARLGAERQDLYAQGKHDEILAVVMTAWFGMGQEASSPRGNGSALANHYRREN